MSEFLQGSVVGFREGLEAFLILIILLRYLGKTGRKDLRRSVAYGAGIGVAGSLLIGGALFALSRAIGDAESLATIWESVASFVALALVTTFIVWMIRHGADMAREVENKAALNLSGSGLISIAALMIMREGAEIAVFTFAGQYGLLSIVIGLVAAFAFALLVYLAMVRIDLRTIFTVTLLYLILQAGFLFGIAIHEGLSALADAGTIPEGSVFLTKAFDLSSTVFAHKDGWIGLPLYVLVGWHSKPEWLQFAGQYVYTAVLLFLWLKSRMRSSKRTAAVG
jgi:high-affinity iron transporter